MTDGGATAEYPMDPLDSLETPWAPCATPSPGSRNKLNPMDVGIHETTPWRGSLTKQSPWGF